MVDRYSRKQQLCKSGWQTLLLYECREFRDRWKNCCDGLVPIEYITAGTKDIRDITIAMIVEACIAAMLIATVITAGITRNIRKSIGRLDRVANGDLTVQEKEKRKKGGEFENFPRHYFIPLQE